MDVIGALRAVGGAVFLLYVPGRVWCPVVLPRMGGELERSVVSIGLSLAFVLLALYVGNVAFGVPLSGASALAWAASITLLGLGRRVTPIIQARLTT